MSLQRYLLADPIEFARHGNSMIGEVDAACLSRLSDVTVMEAQGFMVRFKACGIKEQGRHFLDVEVVGAVRLECQRCLGELEFPFEIASRLELIPIGKPLPDETLEDDDCDPIYAERNLDVLSLVEEEILLALPLAPRHNTCAVAADKHSESDEASPFASLAQLKSKRSE